MLLSDIKADEMNGTCSMCGREEERPRCRWADKIEMGKEQHVRAWTRVTGLKAASYLHSNDPFNSAKCGKFCTGLATISCANNARVEHI